jgi:hypothetical protein
VATKIIDAESLESGRPGSRGMLGGLLDAFLLRDVEALTRKIPITDRQVLLTAVARARQKLESARLLWAHEQYVEGLRLAEESVTEMLRAADLARAVVPVRPAESSVAGSAPVWADVLVALGGDGEDVQDATIAMGGPVGQRPTWNGDVRPEHRRYFRIATRVAEGALERLAPLTTPPSRVLVSRWLRVGSIVALLAAAAITIISLRRAVDVQASASFDLITYEPHKAVDGNPSTEWLLPSNTGGWLEVSFRARTVHTVRVLNAHNPPHNDRASRDFRIEGYRNGQVVHNSKHAFPTLDENPHWMEIAIPNLRLDAVRVVVESFHKFGGGIAELAIE